MMDKLLEACAPSKETLSERVMDSNEQKKRGITITSKYTRLYHGDHVLVSWIRYDMQTLVGR